MKKWMIAGAVTMIMAQVALSQGIENSTEGHPARHGDKMFEKMDTNGDGYLSQDEVQSFHKQEFAKMDTNNDGKVSKEEAKTYFDNKFAQRQQQKTNEN